MTIFKLPDLGEGLPDAEISQWHVKEGDKVSVDQNIVSMETAKAVVEVPSPFEGRIKKLYGNSGDIIKTGSPLVEYEVVGAHINPEEKLQTAFSQGAQETVSTLNSEKNKGEETGATVAGKLTVGNTILKESPTGIAAYPHQKNHTNNPQSISGSAVKATPAIRALAQRLNVDLSTLTPTGPQGTLTTQDVEQAAKHLEDSGTLEPLKGTRRYMAQIMSQSHTEVVPVTVMDDAILQGWNDKKDNKDDKDSKHDKESKHDIKHDLKHDITVRLIQAICEAVKIEPAINAWFETKSFSRRILNKINIGIAVDTPDGLFVPVINDAASLEPAVLRKKLDELKKQTSERSLRPEDLRGASIILSNFGKFAGRYANPIVVPPTVAILGVGRLRDEVVAIDQKAIVCPVLPLALTFDHRALTGGEATRFLGAVIEALERQ